MDTIFLTGATGYIGTYLADALLRADGTRLALLVRTQDREAGVQRLWKPWQLLMDFETFRARVAERVVVIPGDLTAPDLGISAEDRRWLRENTDSVLHCAASLNRKSAKACFNVNLRGTLSILKLAREMQDTRGLRRFTDVSTVAVAGFRKNECVAEGDMVDWDRSDYDPYARTKKFCEHMVEELLPDVSTVVVRPATVLGDDRFPETIQFDMVRAFVWLAQMPVLPFAPQWRMDIVPVNFVAESAAALHLRDDLPYRTFNLSAGLGSETYRDVLEALVRDGFERSPRFAPALNPLFTGLVDKGAGGPRHWPTTLPASLMKVFLPYLTNDTVYDNGNVVRTLGRTPTPFSRYAFGLLRFAEQGNFTYPYRDWPEGETVPVLEPPAPAKKAPAKKAPAKKAPAKKAPAKKVPAKMAPAKKVPAQKAPAKKAPAKKASAKKASAKEQG
ncbi:MAG: NAD-dependent epimerase/dehydratase family protein [Deltaproteobacteria bacterium]|nr:MAG: NAD-dependent epimerase/dehydratase family protein [Deltaproteobacteria bacterium]